MFLKTYGYSMSVSYLLVFNGQQYPSKAILGVAMGKKRTEIQGGAAHAVRTLSKLGFKVIRRVKKEFTKIVKVAAVVTSMLAAKGVVAAELPQFPVEVPRVYASGLDNGYITGAFLTKYWSIGVTASHLSPLDEKYVMELAGTGVEVFCDSGAFEEFSPMIKKFALMDKLAKTTDPAEQASIQQKIDAIMVVPISDTQWRERLATYARLAEVFGQDVAVVAPDKIGDQPETLNRQARYKDEILHLADLGARILVPVQKGDDTQAVFWYKECDVLGKSFIPALPCKRAATTADELYIFVKDVQPELIHLLGMGPFNRAVGEYVSAVASACSQTQVQMDSCQIKTCVGYKFGPKELGGVQKLTYASNAAATFTSNVWEKKAAAFAAVFGSAFYRKG